MKDLPSQVKVTTLTGETLTKNVVWDTSADQFKDKEFISGYITGTVQDGVNAMGLPLTVSLPVDLVIPSGTVYFIDSVDAAPAANATTKAYETVKSLLGSQLLNQSSDQLKTAGNTWGLVDTDANTKGYTDTSDMTATGIYGHNNAQGETLSYAFTLPAGRYKIISAHREWWSMTRPMAASLTIDGKTVDAGTINLNKSSGDLINTAEFVLTSQQLVTYTLTATGDQAPVVSWVAVVEAKHQHSYTEAHTYQNNVCKFCGAKKPVTLAKPVISSISNTTKGITITWKKVTNAASYQVYRKAGNGKWTKVKTLSTTSFRDTKISNGIKYQYKLYAVKGSIISKVSATKTTYRLVTKNLTSAKNVKGKKLSLKWAANSKASGYQIQYATNSKFSKAKSITVSGAKETTKTITKLKKGKKYYVRIRSYKTSGKTKYYSAWSKVKNVKIFK